MTPEDLPVEPKQASLDITVQLSGLELDSDLNPPCRETSDLFFSQETAEQQHSKEFADTDDSDIRYNRDGQSDEGLKCHFAHYYELTSECR